tara:strand:- start:54 stop:989 length:936 start_codon:yes stop_codon:yes gene_type:complete
MLVVIVSVIIIVSIIVLLYFVLKSDTPTTTPTTAPTTAPYDLDFDIADATIDKIRQTQGTIEELTDEEMQVLNHVFEPIFHPVGIYCQSQVIGMIQNHSSFDPLLNPKHQVLQQTINRTKQEQEKASLSTGSGAFQALLTAVEDIIKLQTELTVDQEYAQIDIIIEERERDGRVSGRDEISGELPVFPSDDEIYNLAIQVSSQNEDYDTEEEFIDTIKEYLKYRYFWWNTIITNFTGKNSLMEAEYLKSTTYWEAYKASAYFLEPSDEVSAIVNREIFWLQSCKQLWFLDENGELTPTEAAALIGFGSHVD